MSNAKDKPMYAPLGFVSWGTRREEDLILRFESFLDEFGRGYKRPDAVSRLLNEEERVNHGLSDQDWYEISIYLNEDLFSALNDLAPPYCYFGSQPGYGWGYGFSVSWESLEEAVTSGEVYVRPCTDNPPAPPDDAEYILTGQQYEGATLTDRQGKVLWSV